MRRSAFALAVLAAVVSGASCTRGDPAVAPTTTAPSTSTARSSVYPGSENLVVDRTCSARPETRSACSAVASIVLGSAYPAAAGFPENVKASTVLVRADGRVAYSGEFYEQRSAKSTFDSLVENLRTFFGIRAGRVDGARLVATVSGTARGYAVDVRVTAREVQTAHGRRAHVTMSLVTQRPV